MSEYWTGVCNETLAQAEYDILKASGMNEHDFHSYPVRFTFGESDWRVRKADPEVCTTASAIDQPPPGENETSPKPDDRNEYIWTYEFGSSSNPVLVMVHGYGGSGMIFYKMFTQLAQHFHVYCIDMLGMGRSSRNDFECETYEECELWFVNSIEKWRQTIGLTRFNILGHSFGGFISSKYALIYPKNVKKVLFFSPWATEKTIQEHKLQFFEQIEELPWHQKHYYTLVQKMFDRDSSPFEWARTAGRWLGGYFISKFIDDRMDKLSEEHKNLMKIYFHQITMRKGCGEYGFSIMFPDFMFSEKAIYNFLDDYKRNNTEISFYFGTNDSIDTDYNGMKVSQQLSDAGYIVYMIQEAGHHLYFDNPEDSIK